LIGIRTCSDTLKSNRSDPLTANAGDGIKVWLLRGITDASADAIKYREILADAPPVTTTRVPRPPAATPLIA
jgi:hypothetical protein